MAITLEANLKDIRVTGGTSGAPVTWEDIVAADASGGWGRITTVNATVPKQYTVATDTQIFVGDGGTTSTYVAVESCQITFTNGYFQLQSGADVTKATLRIGRLGEVFYGCSVTLRGLTTDGNVRIAWGGTLLIYWSQIFTIHPLIALSITANVSNSMVVGSEWMGGGNVTMTDSVLRGVTIYTSPANPVFTFSRCVLERYDTYGSPLVTLRDVAVVTFASRNEAVTPVARLYDTSYTAIASYNFTGPQFPVNYEYSTLGLTVVNAAGQAVVGASVVVKDVSGAPVYSGSTSAAGQIPNQDILFRTRTLLGGAATTDVVATPHTVTITKAGLLERVLTLNMSSKHDEVEVLEPLPDWPAVGDVESGVAFDGGAKVGTLVVPDESAVRAGVGYGASGAEFAGEFSPTVVVGEGLAAALANDILSIAIIEDVLVAAVED